MVEAFLLRKREALPPLVDVAQPRVDLVVVHPAWKSKEGNGVEFQVAPVLKFSRKVSGRGLRSRIILQITLLAHLGHPTRLISSAPTQYGTQITKSNHAGVPGQAQHRKARLKLDFLRGQRSTDLYFSSSLGRRTGARWQPASTHGHHAAACPLQRAVTTEESDSSQICVSSTS